jgi:hypothetical protein
MNESSTFTYTRKSNKGKIDIISSRHGNSYKATAFAPSGKEISGVRKQNLPSHVDAVLATKDALEAQGYIF